MNRTSTFFCRGPGFSGAFGELAAQLEKYLKSMGRPTIRVTGSSSGYGLLGGVSLRYWMFFSTCKVIYNFANGEAPQISIHVTCADVMFLNLLFESR